MATGKTAFYNKYRRNDFHKAIEYMRTLQTGTHILPSVVYKVHEVLENKVQTAHEDHERRLFQKYIELGSARSVARYYSIPVNHVCNVVTKVRIELKKAAQQ
jgi:hypothetical protein